MLYFQVVVEQQDQRREQKQKVNFAGRVQHQLFSHDIDLTVYKAKREMLTAHEQTESTHRLPLTSRSNRNARLACLGAYTERAGYERNT